MYRERRGARGVYRVYTGHTTAKLPPSVGTIISDEVG